MAAKKSDRHYMKRALELAAQGRGRVNPNPMVGAVIVKDGQVVGEGYHQAAGEAHAEVNALADAGSDAQGATIYVTLEPCSHYGKTPPCSKALIEAGIARVVAAMEDPNPLIAGRGLEELAKAGIEVDSGLLEEEAKKLNEAFLKYITTDRPFVILKNALTLDGKIATKSGSSKWISGTQSRELVHQLRDEVDGILVGIGTVIADNPRLTTRLEDRGGVDATRIILDPKLEISLAAKVVNLESEAKTVVVTAPKNSETKKAEQLIDKGVKILTVPAVDGYLDLDCLLTKLGELEMMSLLVEGGSAVSTSFLFNGLVDKLIYFIAPKIIGGSEAVGVVGGLGVEQVNDGIEIDDLEVTKSGADLMVTGYPNYRGEE
ncbi:MAG: bifunctional diaminohydroxyphosphoribosylaminopyrimidine deaminase/5-amino-6-(5-phosphoribosylamino)uracil reductase RibD [Bacillota bacterium]